MSLRIDNEWGTLKRVIVGHGHNMGAPATLDTAFDPTSYSHIQAGTYPSHAQVSLQLERLASTLQEHGVEVLRPLDQPELEQVFARDVGMVIEDRFYRSVMIEDRQAEWSGIGPLLNSEEVRLIPDGVRMEGGDVLVLDGALAVGVTRHPDWTSLQTARTNAAALDFLQAEFPHREVMGLELHKHDRDPLKSALHLDCAFMPLGRGEAIVCRDAFIDAGQLQRLTDRFTDILEIDLHEAAMLQSNLLHFDPDTLFIDPQFSRLAHLLQDRGYRLLEVPMHDVGKMGGLFRCTTLPLLRH